MGQIVSRYEAKKWGEGALFGPNILPNWLCRTPLYSKLSTGICWYIIQFSISLFASGAIIFSHPGFRGNLQNCRNWKLGRYRKKTTVSRCCFELLVCCFSLALVARARVHACSLILATTPRGWKKYALEGR